MVVILKCGTGFIFWEERSADNGQSSVCHAFFWACYVIGTVAPGGGLVGAYPGSHAASSGPRGGLIACDGRNGQNT